MDPLSDVFNLLSARSYTTTGLTAPAIWGLHYPGFDGFKFFAVQHGIARFKLDGDDKWHELCAGDGVILTRSSGFSLTTASGEVTDESENVSFKLLNSIADYGGNYLFMIAGKMEIDKTSADLLVNALPPVIFVKSGSTESSIFSWLMNYIRAEKLSQRPGSTAVTDHLMHLIMIEGVRGWMSENQETNKGWIRAQSDPRIMRVLSEIHSNPSHNWRLPELAEIAGMSRAGFARRFAQLTGTTPLNYLSGWRARLASKALRSSKESVKQIAFSLGYGSESAFSTAFKRIYGCPPSEHRRQTV